jgi:hypothetical protein
MPDKVGNVQLKINLISSECTLLMKHILKKMKYCRYIK